MWDQQYVGPNLTPNLGSFTISCPLFPFRRRKKFWPSGPVREHAPPLTWIDHTVSPPLFNATYDEEVSVSFYSYTISDSSSLNTHLLSKTSDLKCSVHKDLEESYSVENALNEFRSFNMNGRCVEGKK